MIRVLLTIGFAIAFQFLAAQTSSSLAIAIKWGEEELQSGREYAIDDYRSVSFKRFRVYLTHIRLVLEEGQDSLILPDALLELEDSASLFIPLEKNVDVFDAQLSFVIGVDSSVQVSGARGGALDPLNGMYWTWQTGYINWKLEGSFHNRVAKESQPFIFHIGGYRPPYETIQRVQIPYSSTDTHLIIDLKDFVSQIEIGNMPRIMQPGEEATKLARKFPMVFKRNSF